MKEIGLKDITLGIGLIAGFVFLISLVVLYAYSLLQSGDYCTCTETIPVMIVIVASLGLFVGSFTYYFLMDRVINRYRKNKDFKKALQPFLSLLSEKERLVVLKLLESKKLSQARIGKTLGLSRVQTTRILQKLEDRNIVKKTKKGKTNIIELNKEISGLP